MYTKIKAAHMATNSGVPMVITSGEVEDSVRRVCKGEQIGTLFEAHDAWFFQGTSLASLW